MGFVRQVRIVGADAPFLLIHSCAMEAKDSLMSIQGKKEGPDNQPLNIWVEFCAQSQGEHSIEWDCYEALVFAECASVVATASRRDQALMWLDSEPGWYWQQDILNGGGDSNVTVREIPCCLADITMLIAADIQHMALNYESPLIQWLNGGWDAYEAACAVQRKKEEWVSG